jgi:nucleotide-binding universal stress UspA family protein
MKLAVAVDLSDDNADQVVQRAAQWVQQVGGTLDVLHVEGARYALDWVGDPAVRDLMKVEAEGLRKKDAGRLARLMEVIPEARRGHARLLEGSPVHALVEASPAYDALMVATHGHTGFTHFWLGSVAEQVVRKARCTVIVLRLTPQE